MSIPIHNTIAMPASTGTLQTSQDREPVKMSMLRFLRGSAAVMAGALAAGPRTGLHVMLCGDAHPSNFGWFASPDRRLVFDINGFDEVCPGPFEWDVKRLAASVTVCARSNGLARKQCRAATRSVVRTYRKSIAAVSGISPLNLYYHRLEADDALK